MKNLNKYLTFIFCAFVLNTNAQNYFNNIYPYSNLVANATSVIALDTGGYLFPSCNFGSRTSLLITRININGDTLLTKEYIKTGYSFSTGTSSSIIPTYDNNYVFSGAIVNPTNNPDALLVKTNENGDTLWTKTYGGANFDNANIACQTPDSGFVLMGVTQSYSNGPASDFYLIKTDKDGNKQWQKVYGTTAAEDCISGQITLDGGFIMSGHRANQLHIVKTDSNGNFKWEKVYGGTAGQGFIKQLSDSTYILVGTKSVTGLSYQAFMAKLTKTGNIIWQQTYGGAGDQQFYAIPIILNNGSIVCSGVSTIGGKPFGLLIKTDNSGNQQWLHTYYKNSSLDNYFYDVKLTSDNGFIMSGFVSNPWLVKVDSNGCEVANCNVGIEEFNGERFNLHVFPNPAINEITVELSNANKNDYLFEIRNVLGELQKTGKIPIAIGTMDISQLASGIYFITAISKDGKQRVVEKFVKE